MSDESRINSQNDDVRNVLNTEHGNDGDGNIVYRRTPGELVKI